MREKWKPFKVRRTLRNLLWLSALCCLVANAGCGNVAQFLTPSPATPRIDWGMSLLNLTGTGVGQFPAKFSFDVNAPPDCSNDFVVYNTNHTGSAGTSANVVAFNQLYSTQGSLGGLCNQDGPSVYWSYYTGNGTALTSVALSLDGSKIAYMENGPTVLHILKWKAGEGSGAGSPAAVDQDISGLPWTSCAAGNSCVASIIPSGASLNSRSAPFVDYTNDVIYVGDSAGLLHKFTGVFNGTPAEELNGWPITVNSGYILTSPVYDSVSGNIFFGDSSGVLRYVRETNSTVGSCFSGNPPCLGATALQVGAAGAIVDGPIVDSTSGFVFAVNGTDTLHFGTILQAKTDLSSAVQFSIGGTGAGSALYDGAFDQTYLNSAAGSVAGFMYVCGKDPANINRPAIYQLSFTATGVLNSVGTPLLMNSINNGAACSPVTEINNTGSSSASGEWIFFSIGNSAANASPIPTASNCRTGVNASTGGRGCLMGINIANAANPAINPGGTWPPAPSFFITQGTNNNANATALAPSNVGATGGIIVDNVSTGSQTSNIYFKTTSSITAGPGLPSCNTTSLLQCAVKLTQSNLN